MILHWNTPTLDVYAIYAYIDPQTIPTDRHIWQSHRVFGIVIAVSRQVHVTIYTTHFQRFFLFCSEQQRGH